MGYDLHITRAESWAQNEAAEITADEWLAVVRADPDLTPAPENGPYFVQRSGQSRHPEGDEPLDDYLRAAAASKEPVTPPTSWWRRLMGR